MPQVPVFAPQPPSPQFSYYWVLLLTNHLESLLLHDPTRLEAPYGVGGFNWPAATSADPLKRNRTAQATEEVTEKLMRFLAY